VRLRLGQLDRADGSSFVVRVCARLLVVRMLLAIDRVASMMRDDQVVVGDALVVDRRSTIRTRAGSGSALPLLDRGVVARFSCPVDVGADLLACLGDPAEQQLELAARQLERDLIAVGLTARRAWSATGTWWRCSSSNE